MTNVETKLDQNGKGAFKLYEDKTEVGEMVVRVNDGKLTVYHTEVVPKEEGKGYAKQLLKAVVDYARAQHLQVVPLCAYVHAQFRHHPEQYADVWTESAN
jgi:uncharacterized protein